MHAIGSLSTLPLVSIRPLSILVGALGALSAPAAAHVSRAFDSTAAPRVLRTTRHAAAQQPAVKRALSDPALSPDGRDIAFVAGGDIWTVPTAGGVARLLIAHPATESRPLWSPDGRQLAFVSSRTGNGDIYIFDLTVGSLRRLTFDDARDALDAWSKDGAWLYYSSAVADLGTSDVWRVPSAGGQPALVAADRYTSEYFAAPSPDGRSVALTARGLVSGQWWRNGHSHIDESVLWLVSNVAPASTGAPTYARLTDDGNGKDAWPMWSPDGATLYYMSDRSGAENLWSQPSSGGSPKQLTTFRSGRVLWPSMAANGSGIVFERDLAVWRFDVAKGSAAAVPITLQGAVAESNAERQTLTQGFSALALAPDSRKLAFVARGDLYVVASRDGNEATRLTSTAEEEDDPLWLPDSRRVVFVSTQGSAHNLSVMDVVTREQRALTTGDGSSIAPKLSPDGRWVAYQRGAREVRVVGIDGSGDRKIADATLSPPPFVSTGDIAWSPDSRYLAYATSDARGFTNLWIAPLDGGAPRQASFGADANAGDIRWAPDGSFLLYRTSMRTETPRIVRVDLVPRTPRFREDQFRDLFGPTPAVPASPSPNAPNTPTTPPGTPPATPATSPQPGTTPPPTSPSPRDSARNVATDSARSPVPGAARARRPVVITWDGIRQRATIVPTQGLTVGDMAISPDGRTLVLTGVAGGQVQLYALSLDELSRDQTLRPLTTSPGGKSGLQFSSDSRDVYFIESGRINAITVESRQARPVPASAEVDVNFAGEKRALFDQAWKYLADNFFDASMHGADWPALRTQFAPYVAGSATPDDLRRTLSLMIGELNASHLGISGPTTGAASVPVAKLGIRLERGALERDGAFVIAEIVAQGPADIAGLRAGARLIAIDGAALGRGVSMDSLLAGKLGRRIEVRAANPGGGEPRVYGMRPVTSTAERALLYRQWVEAKRAYVAKASQGRLGYVHMIDMSQGALDQLYLDLDAENQSREGVVVDVRNNNGGFVNVYAIDVLSRRNYLNFTSRTAPTAPTRSGLGQRMLDRPTVLVTNQETLSDGEDFTEGYRALGLGKVVGEPTAGWIIFTSNVTLLDGGTSLRLPSTRVTDANGKDMELVPRPVDVSVVRPVGESYAGKDSQLDAAVSTLLESLRTRRTGGGR